MGVLIEGRHLSKVYGRRPERAVELVEAGRSREDVERQTGATFAVDDVSLDVARGELHVLMGLSGSGKSTVLRMLNGLVAPTAGSVSFDGRPLADHEPDELRALRNHRIAMVFQHFALLPHRTVRENAAYGLQIRGLSAAERRERADRALGVVGLDGWGDARPDELSGGMQQRVGLARALATDAEVLLMDEPFSALDPVIRREMQDLLLTLRDTIDRTIVFVSHDLDEALRIGDRITLLGAGRVEQSGSAVEVLTRPANDYVRRFVGGVDRTRALTARDLMRPVPAGATGATAGEAGATAVGTSTNGSAGPAGVTAGPGAPEPLAPEATLGDVAARLGDGLRPVAVVQDGRTLGEVTGADVLGGARRDEGGGVMARVDLGTPASDAIDWLLDHFGGVFDGIGSVASDVVSAIESVLSGPPPIVVILVLAALPLLVRRYGIALFGLLAFLLVDGMGLWEQTMQTLAVVLVATVVAVVVGVPLGIWASRHRIVSVVLRPVLDLMQTTPPFVYLIPAVFFFGIGVVPGVVATAVFALAPAVRLTELGIRQVPADVVEAAEAFGAPPARVLRDVQLPLALPTIMAGVNQVIMLALSMVVVAGLTGADGLGSVVTGAVTQLDVGAGVQGGLAVVVLAVYLDRLTSALATPRRGRQPGHRPAPAIAGPAAEGAPLPVA